MRNVSLKEIAQIIGIPIESDQLIAGYQIDSRNVGPGDLFFAMRGERVDGHSFLGQVKERGGVAALVAADYQGPDFGLELLRVENVRDRLQHLAAEAIGKSGAIVIGVTGSVGKTTTKDFIAALAGEKFRVGKTEGSYNSQLTMPITILNMRGDEEVLVIEMGMSEPGELGRLAKIAPPDIAVLTKIGMAHVGAFEDGVAGIAREKGQILTQPKTKWAVFDHEFYAFGDVVEQIGAKKVSFSLEDRNADYVLSTSEGFVDERGVRVYRFDLPFHQLHILHDLLGAIAAVRCLGVEWDEINRQIPKLQLPKMRFEQFEKEGILFVNDAYNANPDSMRAALSSFPEPKSGGKRIAVLGTMGGLGPFSRRSHEEMGRFAQSCADHLLAYGAEAKILCDAFGEVKKPAEHFEDQKALAERLKELMRPGDAVLVKASRIMQLENIFALLDEP